MEKMSKAIQSDGMVGHAESHALELEHAQNI